MLISAVFVISWVLISAVFVISWVLISAVFVISWVLISAVFVISWVHFRLVRDLQRNFLLTSRLWVCRRKESILRYVTKNDEKKNSGTDGLINKELRNSRLATEALVTHSERASWLSQLKLKSS